MAEHGGSEKRGPLGREARGPRVRRRLLRQGSLLAGAGMLAATTAAFVGLGAASQAATSTNSTRYATVQRACPALKTPGASPYGSPPNRPKAQPTAECLAMRLVPASSSTPGAVAYTPPSASSNSQGLAGGLTPADLASAYGFNPNASATGQTVGIVDAFNDPNIQSDVAAFDAHYGLPCTSAPCSFLTVINQTGGPPNPGASDPPNDTTGWTGEIVLDVETVHSVCRNCKVLLVEANSATNSDLGTAEGEAVTKGATEVSNSFGEPESGFSASDQAAFNHPGVPIFVSAGDDGFDFFDWLGGNGIINQPSAPASLPTVISVGGTSLFLNQNGTRNNERVWDSPGPQDQYQSYHNMTGATGGGCSTLFGAQTWQKDISGYSAAVCGGHRLDNDISALADPFTGFDTYNSYSCSGGCFTGWGTWGGTSLASPLVAAMMALAGGSPKAISYPAVTLYGNLVRNPSSHYDVTVGGNGYCGGEGASQCGDPNTLGAGFLDCDYPASGSTPSAGTGACDAATGFDGPTGVGTPNGLNVFKPINFGVITLPSTLPVGTAETFSASKSVDPYPGGSISSYSWNWGDGSSASPGVSPSHTYTKAGTYTITLTITDSYGEKSVNTASVTLGKAPTAVITLPASVTHAKAATFSGTSSSDPNTDGKVTTWIWTWGDGSPTTTTSSATTTHTYASSGTRTVTLTVKDNYGYSSTTVSKSVSVS